MVVLAPGREIGPADIPRQIREGGAARFLPVHVGPIVRERAGVEGRELEFIVRSLVELKLQVEELRRQLGEERSAREQLARAASSALGTPINVTDGTLATGVATPALGRVARRRGGRTSRRIARRVWWRGDRAEGPAGAADRGDDTAGNEMAEIERAAIEAALRETRGNRRKAAELLGIGERTLYRKLRDYQLLVDTSALD